MKTVYVKVKASEELPFNTGMYYVGMIDGFTMDIAFFAPSKDEVLWANSVEYWLKEINLPDEDEIDEIFTRRSANPPYTDIRNIRAIEGANFILKKLK